MTPAQAVPLMGFGEVRHTRLRPARNAFVYPTYFLMLPMRALRAIVVEVNNTFGERHCYLLDRPVYGVELKATKAFHVSPFCRVSGDYRFRFFVDADRTRTAPEGVPPDETALIKALKGQVLAALGS